MLGVESRPDFRRASLVSEIYSESQNAASTVPTTTSAAATSAVSKAPKPPPVRPPPIPGMRRKVPKGKFGLIGLGERRFCFSNFPIYVAGGTK